MGSRGDDADDDRRWTGARRRESRRAGPSTAEAVPGGGSQLHKVLGPARYAANRSCFTQSERLALRPLVLTSTRAKFYTDN